MASRQFARWTWIGGELRKRNWPLRGGQRNGFLFSIDVWHGYLHRPGGGRARTGEHDAGRLEAKKKLTPLGSGV